MSTHTGTARSVRAPRGTELSCKSWPQEAAYRMIQNNLDAEVAERPEDLVVYGGTGKAARTWTDFDRILGALRDLESDETLLVQSGRPVGIARTHPDAPRVLIANSLLVPHWANWKEFRRLEGLGLTMFGQMTAGSWIYIGTQGILQGTYETFGAAARQHFGGSLKGKLVVTGGLGGMGGAQPLSVTMNQGVCLAAEVDPARVQRRLETAYLDRATSDLDEALRWCDEAVRTGDPLSVAYQGNAVDLLEQLLARDVTPDVLTDQTSAHDELNGYVPNRMSYEDALALRASEPDRYVEESMRSMADHVRAMLALQERGAVTFDYGNNLRGQAIEAGVDNALDIIGFVPAYIRPMFCEGSGPFRWVALSGDPADIARTDDAVLETFPDNEHLGTLDPSRARAGAVPGAAVAHLLAVLWRAGEDGPRLQRPRREGRDQGPHRDRARPPRLRLGGVPLPGDRGHEGRLGRDRRLAHPERAPQHRLRRDLGQRPPRRRRRDRLRDPRRPGDRRRRHAGGGGPARARPDGGPGHGRVPPRRRRLRAGVRDRQGTRRQDSVATRVADVGERSPGGSGRAGARSLGTGGDMRIGGSYKQHPGLAEHWDAIVVGSGIGGLSVAATLAKLAHKRVLVLERHYTAGRLHAHVPEARIRVGRRRPLHRRRVRARSAVAADLRLHHGR